MLKETKALEKLNEIVNQHIDEVEWTKERQRT